MSKSYPCPCVGTGEEDEVMMSMKSKRELLTAVSPRYVTATDTDKARTRDVALTKTLLPRYTATQQVNAARIQSGGG